MGFEAGLKAFTAAVIGGIGNLPGAVVGGLAIGLAESFTIGYVSSTFSRRDRVRAPDRRHDPPPERPARARGGAEGLMAADANPRHPGAPRRGGAGSRRRRRMGRLARERREQPRRAARARSSASSSGARSRRSSPRSAIAAALLPAVHEQRLRHPRRLRHADLHAARARPEHRRRLRGAARPRLRRVLRLRRLRLRDARLVASSTCTGTRSSSSRSRSSLTGAPRPPRRAAVAPAGRRLPRDRDALLRAALRAR